MYHISTMLSLTSAQIDHVYSVVHDFLWNGKRPKVAFKTLQKMKSQGGLKLFDLAVKQDTIHIGWIFKLESDELLSTCAYNALHLDLRNMIWKCNISAQDVEKVFGHSNEFWK